MLDDTTTNEDIEKDIVLCGRIIIIRVFEAQKKDQFEISIDFFCVVDMKKWRSVR